MSEASATAFVAQQAGRFREIALRNFSLSNPVWETLAVVALCPVLLSAAIWNGFPLIFYDTGAYMLQSFGHKFVPERSAVFSIFLLIAGGGVSLWLVAVLQTIMASFVMVETARAVAPRITLPILLAIGAVLTLLTGLPWYAGQIEPDIFTPLVVLCLYLLAFHPTRLGKARCAALVIIAALSTAMHPSHLGLGVELALLLVGYRLFVALRRKPWPSIDITRPISAALLGLSLVLAGNYIYTGRMFVSRAGPVFMFARMLQDGVVQ